MSIEFPIEVWQLADRYAECLDRIQSSSGPIVQETIEINRLLQSAVDYHLTSDVTIETSIDRLLTFYRDPLNRLFIYVLTIKRLHRPSFDRPSTELIEHIHNPSEYGPSY